MRAEMKGWCADLRASVALQGEQVGLRLEALEALGRRERCRRLRALAPPRQLLPLLRQVGDDSLAPLGVYRGGVLHGDNAAFVEVVELVLRECEKRRDADGDAGSSSRGRSLEAERFAVARRETHEGVTARENGFDRLALSGTQRD